MSVKIKTDRNLTGSRLGTLLQSLDRLSGSSNAEEVEQLRYVTSRLQQLVSGQDKIRKDVMSKSSGGLEILLCSLESSMDSQISLNITYTLLDLLLTGKRSSTFVSRGATQVILSALITANREQPVCDELIVVLHSVLAKIGVKDRKFGVKARLSGALPITLGLVRAHTNNFKVLLPAIQVLKIYSMNAVNSSCLGKSGAVSAMFKILAVCGRKHLNIVKIALDTLAQLVKSKSNSARAIGQGGMTILLTMAFDWHRSDSRNRHFNLRKSILIVIRNITTLKSGRKAFTEADGIRILYAVAQEMSEVRELETLVTIISLILRKCFPKNRLPVHSIKSSIPYQLPEAAAEYLQIPMDAQGDDVLDDSDDQDDDLSSDDDEENQQEFDDLDEDNKNKLEKRSAEDLFMYEQFFPELLEFTEEKYLLKDEEKVEEGKDTKEYNGKSSSTVIIPTATMDSGTVHNMDSRITSNLVYNSKENRFSLPNLSKYNYMVSNKSLAVNAGDLSLNMGGIRLVSDSGNGSSVSECSLRSSANTSVDSRSVDGASVFNGKNNRRHSKSHNNLRGSRSPSKVHKVSKSMTSVKSSLSERCRANSPSIPSSRSKVDSVIESFNPDLMITSLTIQSSDSARTDRNSSRADNACEDINASTLQSDNYENYSNPDIFVEVAHKTRSVQVLTKLAFPEFNGHISPIYPEPFNDRPGGVQRNMIFDDIDRMIHPQSIIDKVVFDLDQIMGTNPYLRSGKSREPAYQAYSSGDIKIKNFPSPEGTDMTNTLQFNSLFESGNLRKVIQIRRYEYDLILNSDINCNHHHQWFYFEVSGMKTDVPYRFNIVNCEKPNSQFNFGMQPLLYSVREAIEGHPSWIRAGTDVCYYRNHYSRSSAAAAGQKGKSYFSLTFTMVFPYDDDICYMAYHYPYTYSQLQTHLFELETNLIGSGHTNIYYKNQTFCETLGGNPCPVLTITSYPHSRDKEGIEQFRCRPYIFLSGRVHPGESNASWVMKGSLNFLMSQHPTAQALREVYIFKIVPMLNPDGVINGSHRCSLSGEDLNRRWQDPSPDLHPTIYHTKGLLQYLQLINKTPLVYCDYHGHSRRKNVFMYGCSSALSYLPEDNATVSSGSSGSREDTSYRTLPRILSNAPSFSFNNCSFVVEKSKEATARVVVWREIGVARSYTMESTYCGCDQGPYKGLQIGTRELEEMGKKFCEALLKLRRTSQHMRQPSSYTSLTVLVATSLENDKEQENHSPDEENVVVQQDADCSSESVVQLDADGSGQGISIEEDDDDDDDSYDDLEYDDDDDDDDLCTVSGSVQLPPIENDSDDKDRE